MDVHAAIEAIRRDEPALGKHQRQSLTAEVWRSIAPAIGDRQRGDKRIPLDGEGGLAEIHVIHTVDK